MPGTSRQLVDALLAGGVLAAGTDAPRLIETHISWVILSGSCAWKIKKPVTFGFVDFSTLEARHRACLEELRLNRRLTPDLYLGVVAIRGTPAAPALDGNGPVIEYAVRMVRFPDDAVVGEAPLGQLADGDMDGLADLVGRFHRDLASAPPDADWGSPDRVWAPVAESLGALRGVLADDDAQSRIAAAGAFLAREFARRRRLIGKRHASGAVRECHGDLHLGNIARIGGRLLPFDALEFDPALRWIDVMNEVAFLMMDLETRDRRSLAFRFLNGYLDVSGEHGGLPLLPFYLAYRALVRAKVRALGPGGKPATERQAVDALLAYAAAPLPGIAPALVLMAGTSGSGKSWLATRIAAGFPAIHLRSDVERKRLFGLGLRERTGAGVEEGIYAPDASSRTYARLASLAGDALGAGIPAIIDATNLRREHRAPLLAAARATGCPTAIVWCRADDQDLSARVSARLASGHDPSEAGWDVVRRQLQMAEPPHAGEADLLLGFDSGSEREVAAVVARLRQLAVMRSGR